MGTEAEISQCQSFSHGSDTTCERLYVICQLGKLCEHMYFGLLFHNLVSMYVHMYICTSRDCI